MKIAVLSNTNLDPLVKKLQKKYNIYKPNGYDNWVQELLDESSGLNQLEPEAVFIILDGSEIIGAANLEYAKEQMDQYLRYIEKYIAAKAPGTNVFISNFDIPARRILDLKQPEPGKAAEGYWYDRLCRLSGTNENVYVFDIKNLAETMGRREFYSKKLWYLGGIKYSMAGHKAILDAIDRYLRGIKGSGRKCIVLDLDNTLWGGVVGEVGLQGIEISDYKEGARYKDFQLRLKDIKSMGIILAVVSKNNYEDVMEVFRNHKCMYLKEEDFAALKINWESKTKNIEELASELNIGLDSIVFIDDNPVERDAVRYQLPMVAVPDFPEDSSDLEDFIIKVYNDYFFKLKTTEEDREKTGMYIQNSERDSELKASGSLDEYLLRLQTHIWIWKAGEEDVERIVQLIQKTNQFNLTTKRYSEKDVKRMLGSAEHDVYVASVEDRFGDNGKTVVVIMRKDKDQAEIDTFLMSCRIMGRFVEDRVITFLEKKYKAAGCKEIKASYISSGRNLPVADLFERLGYELIGRESGGNKLYKLCLDQEHNNRKIYGELTEL